MENIELYFTSSAFRILAYSAMCFPFMRSSMGKFSWETGTLTPAATIPFKHAATRDVNESVPVYKIALLVALATLFLPKRNPVKKHAGKLFIEPFQPYFLNSLLCAEQITISPFMVGFKT
jgi:hypothetical protein